MGSAFANVALKICRDVATVVDEVLTLGKVKKVCESGKFATGAY